MRSSAVERSAFNRSVLGSIPSALKNIWLKDNFLKIQFNANEDILEKAKIVSAKLSILREVCEYLENFETSKEQIDYYKKYLSDSISTDPFVSSNPYCVYVSLELLKDFEAKKLYQSYTD